MAILSKSGGFWASEGKLALAFEAVERQNKLILKTLLEGLNLSAEDRQAIRDELSGEIKLSGAERRQK